MAAALLGLSNSPYFIVEMFVYAFFGGLLPSLVWMWFWMHENYKHNEPKGVIALTFVFGMIAVFMVYPFQKLLPGYLGFKIGSTQTLVLWSFIEELFKFLVAYFCALRLKEVFNEPIDAFIYMMTAALGFVAMENTFYLLAPLLQGDTIGSILTGNLRFMGASLLHVVASGALSVFIGYAFYKNVKIKESFWILGIIVATILHSLFNYFIIELAEKHIFLIFSFVWMTTVILILALEHVKMIKKF